MSNMQNAGKTTLSPDVLLTIARMATLGVEGVSRMAAVPGGFDRLFRRGGTADGVQVTVDDGLVYMDLFIILKQDVNVREVSRNVQHHVARAISEMIGMEVGHVNIHIEDIDFQTQE